MPVQTNARRILDYAILQSVAESYLDQWTRYGGSFDFGVVVSAGNNNPDYWGTDTTNWGGATGLTTSQVQHFLQNFTVIAHYPNDASGFSATLFRNTVTGEYTISFRSTEFETQERGGNWEADGSSGADGDISLHGFAMAQLAAMENFYAHLRQGSVPTGLNPITGEMQWASSPEALQFANEINTRPAMLTATGFSLGGHLATAFALMHNADDGVEAYTFNPAGVGGIDGLAPNGQQITEMIALYNFLKEWDGQEASLPAEPTPFIDLHMLFHERELWNQIIPPIPATPQIAALEAMIAAAQLGVGMEPGSLYENVRYEAIIGLIDLRTDGTLVSGLAAGVDMAANFVNGGFRNDDFRSTQGEVQGWDQFIHQYFGHGVAAR